MSHHLIDVFHNIFIFKKYISGKWLVPPKPSPNKSWCQMFSEKLPHHFTISYWKNNRPFLCFLFFIIGVNVISMIQRAYYFKDFSMLNGFTPNIFYLVSRACGNVWSLQNWISAWFLTNWIFHFKRHLKISVETPSKPFLSQLWKVRHAIPERSNSLLSKDNVLTNTLILPLFQLKMSIFGTNYIFLKLWFMFGIF